MNFAHKIPKQHLRIFEIIRDAGRQLNQPVYVVGGYVRDYYLDRLKEEPDIDFVTLGSGISLAQNVHAQLPGSNLSVFKQFGTAQVKINDLELEFVGARKESYRRDSRKPIVEDGTLKDDQERRDLTINAMSWSLNSYDFGLLNDPFGGLADLKNNVCVLPSTPTKHSMMTLCECCGPCALRVSLVSKLPTGRLVLSKKWLLVLKLFQKSAFSMN